MEKDQGRIQGDFFEEEIFQNLKTLVPTEIQKHLTSVNFCNFDFLVGIIGSHFWICLLGGQAFSNNIHSLRYQLLHVWYTMVSYRVLGGFRTTKPQCTFKLKVLSISEARASPDGVFGWGDFFKLADSYSE